jgi:uncharacterized protein HemY
MNRYLGYMLLIVFLPVLTILFLVFFLINKLLKLFTGLSWRR